MSNLPSQLARDSAVAFVPELLYAGGRFERGRALVCDERTGRVVGVAGEAEGPAGRVVPLPGRALLPGMVNAHSHAFQRVIRGRTEHRAAAHDSFWTWREMMYAAASRLTPEDLYDASRMAFMEMALAGITAVGEFHYLHRAPGGAEYEDPNLLARQVVRAAREAGLRVALLRVAYARAGHNVAPDERQRRFIEPDPETYLRHTEALDKDLARDEEMPAGAARAAWVGVAPHSIRAVPSEYLRAVGAFAEGRALPLHVHVAEQPAEVSACLAETGRTPVALLGELGLLGPRFTGVHAVHVTLEEVQLLGRARATVCACPTTERNLGDGVVPADRLFEAGVRVALGTDSHAQIDLLEDARELEYHLRLQRLERNVLARPAAAEGVRAGGGAPDLSELAARLFGCATAAGAESVGAPAGELAPGLAADFFTVDLNDPSVAGAGERDLLPAIVFSLSRAAVREVYVGARPVVEAGRHREQEEIVTRFAALQRKLWGA
ncbi:MAG TPA: formimidoylglutamate deiminase [Pyrinomonadaceae bacterium]|nr:formimidoylglutamate deiminase [Pyrinomonadaceae bacterium]